MWGRKLQEFALVQNGYLISNRKRLVHVMGDIKGCSPRLAKPSPQILAKGSSKRSINTAEWFVKKVNVGVLDQCFSESYSLLFTARNFTGTPAKESPEFKLARNRFDAPLNLRSICAGHTEREGHIVIRSHVRIQIESLRGERNPSRTRRKITDILTIKINSPS
jgi:hypothetical protein